MFTGIVEELGEVRRAGERMVVGCSAVVGDSDVGASVAVNGVCLTVVERRPDSLAFDLSEETLRRTTLGDLRPGDCVNLERPVTLVTRLGGHLVQGHVDGVATISSFERDATGAAVTIEPPSDLMRFIVDKGSVAVDGVSLTAASLTGTGFGVALIPHTLAVTTLGRATTGMRVNVEVDVMARYVESLLRRDR